MKLNMVTVTIPGWAMGSIISQKVLTGGSRQWQPLPQRPGQIGKKGGQENGGVGHIDSDIQEYQGGPVSQTLLRILRPATTANSGSTIMTTGTPMDATRDDCISLLHTKSKRDSA